MRFRFAPSPTGFLHLGGLRTALFNYFLARKHPEGRFILRIEDTDRSRLVPGVVEQLQKTLKWAGIEADEGPDLKDPYGPYIQSERINIYQEKAREIIAAGHAYPCFCPKERLQLLKGPNGVGRYDRLCQGLSTSEATARIRNGEPHVIRLKIPQNERIAFNDAVYGRLSVSTSELDDAVLMKSDGFPTYHFANVIDDHLMRISTVVRGQEWIASTPLHLLIYRAFNWQAPVFAHLPLLVNPDGSKLSKRQNAAHVQTYISDGFLPAALVNFVAFLGWTPSDSRKEVLSMGELTQEFSLQRVNQSDATVNFDKLRWLNRQHLRQSCEQEQVINELRKLLPNEQQFSDDYLKRVLICASERCALLPEIPLLCSFFFQMPDYTSPDAQHLLSKLRPSQLASLHTHPLSQLIKEQPMLMRLVLTGSRVGAPVYQIAAVLGDEECLVRIDRFKQSIANQLPRQNQN